MYIGTRTSDILSDKERAPEERIVDGDYWIVARLKNGRDWARLNQ